LPGVRAEVMLQEVLVAPGELATAARPGEQLDFRESL
jgi:hypothetical protein